MVRRIKKVVRNPDGTLRVVEVPVKTAVSRPGTAVHQRQTATIRPKTAELGVGMLRQIVENHVLQAKFPQIKAIAAELASLGHECWSCNRESARKRGPIINKLRRFLAFMDEKDAQEVKKVLGIAKFRVSYVDDEGKVRPVEK